MKKAIDAMEKRKQLVQQAMEAEEKKVEELNRQRKYEQLEAQDR